MIHAFGYTAGISTMVVAVIAALWLITLIVATVSPRRFARDRSFRRAEKVVLVMTIVFGAAWFYTFGHIRSTFGDAPKSKLASCSSVEPGDREARVKERLGEPDSIVGDEEARGRAASVWVYRRAGCAVHMFGDTVEAVE